MTFYLLLAGLLIAATMSLIFSALTYALRDFTRAKLKELLDESGKSHWYQPTVDKGTDLIFATAAGRLLANMLVFTFVLAIFENGELSHWLRYLASIAITLLVTLFCSVAIPHALARYAGEQLLAASAPILHGFNVLLTPVVTVMRLADASIGRLTNHERNSTQEVLQEQLQQDILSVVEEGEKEGVVDETEREMIESVIHFRSAEVGDIMTPRPEIIAIPANSTLAEIKATLEDSGHSRIPVYDGSIDKIVGILYARDLLKHIGAPPEQFAIRSAVRPAIFVPQAKPLPDLLEDFRLQKIHMALVLDEYNNLAGLVTIEDVLEQLVGDISDEHEPAEPAMFKRLSDIAADVNAHMSVAELNRTLGLNLPEDAGYETLGGFVSTTLGRIPKPGIVFEHEGAKYTIIDAEPSRVIRVKIELMKLSNDTLPR